MAVRHSWAVFVLLWAMLYNIVPLQLFHVHSHADTHCETAQECHNTNPCHISLHHTHSGLAACNHTSHVATQQDECGFCNYLSHQRQLSYVTPALFLVGQNIQASTLYRYNAQQKALVFALSQTNKGPPTVIV